MRKRKRANQKHIVEVLEVYGKKVKAAVIKTLSEQADDVVESAKARCPVDTGRLRDSIHKEVQRGGTKIHVVADAQNAKGFYYGKLVEFDPRINEPFLYPALEENYDKVRKAIAHAVKEGLKK